MCVFLPVSRRFDVLGAPMDFDSFITWVREFTQCMVSAVERGQLPNVDEVVRVVTRHQLMNLEDEAVDLLKKEFAEASQDGKRHLPEKDLEELVQKAKAARLEHFTAAAQFGPEEEIEASMKKLEAKMADVESAFRDRNQLAMTQILVKFAPWATLAVAFFFLDWLSDWVCDSYLEVCVQASSVMAFYYTVFFIVLLGSSAMKYKEYGPHGLWAALPPLVSKVFTNFEQAVDAAKRAVGIKPSNVEDSLKTVRDENTKLKIVSKLHRAASNSKIKSLRTSLDAAKKASPTSSTAGGGEKKKSD